MYPSRATSSSPPPPAPAPVADPPQGGAQAPVACSGPPLKKIPRPPVMTTRGSGPAPWDRDAAAGTGGQPELAGIVRAPRAKPPRPNGRLGRAPRAGGLVRLLWRAMRARGVSRQWLARQAGIPIARLDSWRSGLRKPRVEALERCFAILEMDLVAMPRPREVRGVIHHPLQEGLPL